MGPKHLLFKMTLLLSLLAGCGSQFRTLTGHGSDSQDASLRAQPPAPVALPQPVQPAPPVVADPSGGYPPPNTGMVHTAHLQTPPTLYVIISGNATCHPVYYQDRFPGLIKSFLYSGFISNRIDTGLVRETDNIIFACYELMSPSMQFYDVRNQPKMTAIDHSQLDAIVLPQMKGYARTVVIGHSYGGWRAMKLVSSPQFQAYSNGNTSLVTVDPISKVNCQGPFDRDCRMAPSDFTHEELSNLHTTSRWLNAVQDLGIVIGSDAMPAAHANLTLSGVNHFTISTDPRLWTAINQFLSL